MLFLERLKVVRQLDQLFSDQVGKRCDEAEPSLNPNISNIDFSIPATDLCVSDQVRLWLYILIRKVRLLKMGPIYCPETSVNNYNVRCIIFQDSEGLKLRYLFCIGHSLSTNHENSTHCFLYARTPQVQHGHMSINILQHSL